MNKRLYALWISLGFIYLLIAHSALFSWRNDETSAFKAPVLLLLNKEPFETNTSLFSHALWNLPLFISKGPSLQEESIKKIDVTIDKHKVTIGQEAFECVGIFVQGKKRFAIFESLNPKENQRYLKLYENDFLHIRVQLLKIAPTSLELLDVDEHQTHHLKQFEVNPLEYLPKSMETQQ